MTTPQAGDRVRVPGFDATVSEGLNLFGEKGLLLRLEDGARGWIPASRVEIPHPPVKVGDIIGTREELDALPVRATVLDSDGDAWQRHPQGWRCTTGDTYVDCYAPFTVLHLPDGAA